jgi:hypothetical protein
MPATFTRARSDRPDEVSGPSVHVIYALAADGTDEGLDTNGVIGNLITDANYLMDQLTPNRILRIDTYNRGVPDVTFFRLSEKASQLRSMDSSAVFDTVTAQLAQHGFDEPSKRYLVYFAGVVPASGAFGVGFTAYSSGYALVFAYGSQLAANAGVPNPIAPTILGQNGDPFSSASLHQLLHSLGFVPSCAPHYDAAYPFHVTDNRNDLMHRGGEADGPVVLDAGHDDYYEANIPGCLDLSNSPYLLDATSAFATLKVNVNGALLSPTVSSEGEIAMPCAITKPSRPCTYTVRHGAAIAIFPQGNADSHWIWGGACTGRTSSTCTLHLDINYGARACVVPTLKRLILASAREKLTAADCRLGSVTRVASKTVAAGRIVRQSPLPDPNGFSLKPGYKVNVTVSRGR